MSRYHPLVLLLSILAFSASSCDAQFKATEVGRVNTKVPTLDEVYITDAAKFLNDLKLSPYWKVERGQEGTFVAKARSIGPEGGLNSQFLFEVVWSDLQKLGNLLIHNEYLSGGGQTFSTFSVAVVFKALPEAGVLLATGDEGISLPVFESYDSKIGPNSHSEMAVRLSKKHEIFLVLREQGADAKRATTWKKLPGIMRHLKSLATLPAEYLVIEQYADFYRLLFTDTTPEHRIQRLPGIQDRDTFYGFLMAKENQNLEGISLKVSHLVYCGGECTRAGSRRRKAEYLGTPSDPERDRLFFLIEDNAVYLKQPYDNDFGTFSGTKSFAGTLEIMDGDEKPIVTTKDQFKGWER